MGYLNIVTSKNEFDYYYKTKKELAYLENYLSLLHNNGKGNNFQSNGSPQPQNMNMFNNNNIECKLNLLLFYYN